MVISIVIGVLIGSVVTFLALIGSEIAKERRHARRSSLMLSHEIEHNLSKLENQMDSCKPTEMDEEFSEFSNYCSKEDYLSLCRMVEVIAVHVDYENEVWKALLDLVPKVLKADEIDQVMDFYAQMDRLRNYFDRIVNFTRATRKTYEQMECTYDYWEYLTRRWSSAHTIREEWNNYEQLSLTLLAKGNPISRYRNKESFLEITLRPFYIRDSKLFSILYSKIDDICGACKRVSSKKKWHTVERWIEIFRSNISN